MDVKTLHACLNGQCGHILDIPEGLDEEALRRPVLPSGWNPATDLSADQIFALYRREIELSNAVIEATSLDAAPAWWPETAPPEQQPAAIAHVRASVEAMPPPIRDAHLALWRSLGIPT